MTTRCGSIALLGRPNAGKSTLMNRLIGAKIAGISRKPQTTRDRIRGVCTEGESQLVFCDTPGLHESGGRAMNINMMREAWSTLQEVDIVCYLIDALRGPTQEDRNYIERISTSWNRDIQVILSQVDRIPKTKIREQLRAIKTMLCEMRESHTFKGPVKAIPISAKRDEDVTAFKKRLCMLVPEGPWQFAEDDLTDRPTSFIIGELVREQLFREVGQEVPYSAVINIRRIEESENLCEVFADIVLSRDSHKGIVIGSQGSRLGLIREGAERSIAELVGSPAKVHLHVRVE